MSEATSRLNEMLQVHFSRIDLDLIEMVQIPKHVDRKSLLNLMQQSFGHYSEQEDTFGFFIQVKPKSNSSSSDSNPLSSSENGSDSQNQKIFQEAVYLATGKLNIPFLMKNADLLFESGEYSLARNIYKTIAKSGECTGVSLNRLGRCYEAEGKVEEARSYYEESAAYTPSLDSYQRLANLLIRSNLDQVAAETLSRALNLKDLPNSTRFELHKACGNCWARAQKSVESEYHFKRGLELNPSADELRSNLGSIYLQSGRVAEAKRNFQDAIASNSKNYQAMTGLGSCLLAEGSRKAAHDCFIQALEIEIKNPTAIFYLVKCAYEIKSYASATRVLSEYIQVSPVNGDLLYSLAGLQFHLGRMAESKQTVQRVLEINPRHLGASDLLGRIDRYMSPSG